MTKLFFHIGAAGIVALILLVAAPANAQTCYTSFHVKPQASIPGGAETFPYEGWSCRQLEEYRGEVYVANRDAVGAKRFADLEEWRAVHTRRIAGVAAADQRLQDARTASERRVAITIAVHEVGQVISLYGCATSAATAGLSCVIPIGVNYLVTFYGLLTADGTDDARAALNEARSALDDHRQLSQAELDAVQTRFDAEFQRICGIVRTHCLD